VADPKQTGRRARDQSKLDAIRRTLSLTEVNNGRWLGQVSIPKHRYRRLCRLAGVEAKEPTR